MYTDNERNSYEPSYGYRPDYSEPLPTPEAGQSQAPKKQPRRGRAKRIVAGVLCAAVLIGGSFGAGTNEHIGLQNSLRRLETVYGRKGLLWVDSAPGEGTRFTIRIPWEHPGNERKDQDESSIG